MQSHSQLNSADRPRILPLVLLLAAAVVFLVSCGPNIIKGRPPFISISSMSLIDDRLAADFDIRNQNGVPMNISMIDITVTVNGVQLTRENREFELLIGANSVEEVNVEELPDEFSRNLLESLASKEVKSLPFDLEGRVRTVEDGYLSFAHKGHLYPVPGKPGYFRSAVTRAKGLTREEQF
ncbi:MAG: LEA type 2 family protein [Xanthomonadales bacterium]|jgi:LEA14-like dessication related protein|nr:LEA type 2 family protein [Xanthomonadales bacterium]MDH3939481.1 LEA type 2 family protein [Xanthomonadales bacterium]MDH3999664.1 LEA type 2 family protein [Xanthomonadales bacterium]